MDVQIRTLRATEGKILPEDGFRWWAEVIDAEQSVVYQTGPHLSEAGAVLRAKKWARENRLSIVEPSAQ
jgi:hypothetical protein